MAVFGTVVAVGVWLAFTWLVVVQPVWQEVRWEKSEGKREVYKRAYGVKFADEWEREMEEWMKK